MSSARPPDSRPASATGEVRSLLRGLNVLGAVNDFAPASVSQIVLATDLPKATVIRLLATLRQGGYIRQDPTSTRYLPLPAVRRLAGAMRQSGSFAEQAGEVLNEFGQQISWPSELLIAESDAMAILASNRETSPIRLRLFEQRRFPMLDSAGGIAFLSGVAPSARQEIVIRLSAAPGDGRQASNTRAARAFKDITDAQKRGYSVHEYRAPVSGMRAVGVAIKASNKSVGALVLLTLANVVTTTQLEHELLPALQATAQKLGGLYAETLAQSAQ
ncbi:MAG: IclR family transcriptional regulator [Burkholderiaceae bacterium]